MRASYSLLASLLLSAACHSNHQSQAGSTDAGSSQDAASGTDASQPMDAGKASGGENDAGGDPDALDGGTDARAPEPQLDAGVATDATQAQPDGGATPLDAGTDAASQSDGGTLCESHTIRGHAVPPDMLIVLDKSGSMNPDSNAEMVDRWTGSVQGIEAVTSSLESKINFGLMTFPIANNQCGAGMVDVPIATLNADAIKKALDAMQANGGTPTQPTLAVAHTALKNATAEQPKYVLLVTDGSPNCVNGTNGGPNPLACLSAPDFQACLQAQQNTVDSSALVQTIDELKSMAADHVKTYVLGFGTQNVPNLAAALDMMAVAGGTGDTHHHPVEDQASLTKVLSEISAGAISCDYHLQDAVSNPSFVRVRIDNAELGFHDANGWVLGADQHTITLQGSACATLRDGNDHALSVEVLCSLVTEI